MHRKKKRHNRDLTFPANEEVNLFAVRDEFRDLRPQFDFDYFQPLLVEKPKWFEYMIKTIEEKANDYK